MTIYLDNNATTALDPAVLEAMLPYLAEHYGNPSSIHTPGRVARTAIDNAREQVADLVGAHPTQLIFTSGGTEANNLALNSLATHGVATFCVSAIEHPSVLEPARQWQAKGWKLELVPVDTNGSVNEDAALEMLQRQPTLMSVMMANNETGVIQPLSNLAHRAREQGVIVHTDAVQAVGKIPVDFNALGVHLMSLSSHKIYGPKGVGALVVDKALDIPPLLFGGGHEKGRRSGTENVAAIVGFAKAAELAQQQLEQRSQHMLALRIRLEAALNTLDGVHIIAESAQRLPNTVLIAIPGIEGETLLMSLDAKGIALSSGSACASGDTEPSHVLRAMNLDEELVHSTLRISFGKDSTQAECDAVVAAIKELTQMSQQMASVAW
ncbi:MAG: cysteine desulfurase [Gammaproteobacteria bacterium]|nr:MAG: cysteine desulfurase [Gammaproteobacteria bacterium]